jgi:hypothetical protein
LSFVTTDQKGAIAETAIIHAAVKLGIDVYRPIAEGGRCDLILDLEGRLTRVQCKWAAHEGDVIVVRCYSSRRGATGFIKRGYTSDEIDAIAAYCVSLDRSYFIPMEQLAGRSHLQLRLGPARNNQRLGINWAEQFELEATLGRPQGP